MNYDLSHEAAMARVREAGIKAGLVYGSPKEMNPYRGSSFHKEAAEWEAGRQVGAAERKRGAK